MKKKIISIFICIISITSMFCINVFAISKEDMLLKKMDDNITKYYYPLINSTDHYTDIYMFLGNGVYKIIYTTAGTKISIANNGQLTINDTNFYYKEYNTQTKADNLIFLCESDNYNFTKMTQTYVYQTICYTNTTNGEYKMGQGDTTIIAKPIGEYYKAWYMTKYGKEPTEEGNEEGETGTNIDKEYQTGVLGWFQRIFDSISNIPTTISTLWDNIKEGFNNTIKAITEIPEKIKKWYEETTSTTIKMEDGRELNFNEYMIERLNENLAEKTFYATLNEFGTRFQAFFKQDFNELPTELISVDLSQNESKVLNFGDKKITLLDVKWYERYKPFVDGFISCFLWMGFFLMLWKKLPALVNGQSVELASQTTAVVEYDNKQQQINKKGNDK